jgi:hypothetical protein
MNLSEKNKNPGNKAQGNRCGWFFCMNVILSRPLQDIFTAGVTALALQQLG